MVQVVVEFPAVSDTGAKEEFVRRLKELYIRQVWEAGSDKNRSNVTEDTPEAELQDE